MRTATAFDKPAEVVRLLLTERQAAEALGISPKALWALRKAGAIPAVRIGRSVRYWVKDLTDYIERNRTTAPARADEMGEEELNGERQ